jgi:hypothetical protein
VRHGQRAALGRRRRELGRGLEAKAFGCWKIAIAASAAASANRAGSVVPPTWATSTTSIPNPGA